MNKTVSFRMRYHKGTETLHIVRLEDHVPVGKSVKVTCPSNMKNVIKSISEWVRVNCPDVGQYFENTDIKGYDDANCKNITMDAAFYFEEEPEKFTIIPERFTLVTVDVFGRTPLHHHTAEINKWTPLRLLAHHMVHKI